MILFGVPRKTLSDYGDKFTGDELYNMYKAFSIKTDLTPSYYTWSNGLCKRHNQTLINMF